MRTGQLPEHNLGEQKGFIEAMVTVVSVMILAENKTTIWPLANEKTQNPATVPDEKEKILQLRTERNFANITKTFLETFQADTIPSQKTN